MRSLHCKASRSAALANAKLSITHLQDLKEEGRSCRLNRPPDRSIPNRQCWKPRMRTIALKLQRRKPYKSSLLALPWRMHNQLNQRRLPRLVAGELGEELVIPSRKNL